MKILMCSKNLNGCMITIIISAVFLIAANSVFSQFEADFEGSPRSGDTPLTVIFTDKSEGQISSWGWSFPGGSPSSATGSGPHTVIYYNPGSYDVTLKIVGPVTQNPPPSDTETKSNYIKVYEQEPDRDYGDAPDDGSGHYPTLKANNGASHIIDDSIYLGTSVDSENDGQPDSLCLGDDINDDSDDEDGFFIPPLVAGDTALIKVTVHGSGYLNGWIDFNQDRDWEDEGEQVFNAVSLSDGTHNLELNVPVTADTGNTYGRFRFSDESDLSYEGPGSLGEVEDYYLEILAFYHDSLALVALYDSTDGDHWDNNAHWLTGSLDSWYGIRVSSGRVIKIFLDANNLTGVIPAVIGNLTKLQDIDFIANQLTGPIPPEIGNLTNLEDLGLSSNQLTDSIPAELGNLMNLKDLRLDFNQLTGPIPTELGNLVNLQNLILFDNQLIGIIPVELGNLIHLERLILSMNQITGTIPIEIINLPNLIYLNLGDNLLDGLIPSELANMINLQGLGLGENQFSGPIPPDLGNLTNLTDLSLNYNQLTDSIPSELGNLTNLRGLFFNDNQLTGFIPSVLGNLTNLEYLTFGNNQLIGSIPAELGNLTQLEYLTFDNNQLTGSIPSELGNLTNLEDFYLNSNQLTGPIPSNLINLTNLYSAALDLRWNGIYTNDTSLRNFLNSKQIGGDWESTQTIPPENVTCSSMTDTSVTVSWSLIAYTGDAGGYKVFYSTDISGPYIEFGMTSDKTIGSLEVTGLNAETKYYFMVKTQTDPHADNSNTVVSEPSDIVSAETEEPAAVGSEKEENIPDSYALYQNHPNPFNLESEITYDLPKSTYVTLIVYNMLGQPVRTLVDSKMPAGSHQVIWDARDQKGQGVPSGIYIFILKSDSYTEKRKALLMK